MGSVKQIIVDEVLSPARDVFPEVWFVVLFEVFEVWFELHMRGFLQFGRVHCHEDIRSGHVL